MEVKNEMDDRGMLMFAYGALRAANMGSIVNQEGLSNVIKIIESHVYKTQKPEIKKGENDGTHNNADI